MPTIEETVHREVSRFLQQAGIDGSSSMLVAFSGGSDSLALLLALRSCLPRTELVPVYVDHRIRPSAELEAERECNEQNCRRLGLSLQVVDLGEGAVAALATQRGFGTEEAARHLRYAALLDAGRRFRCRYVAMAHNADDQLETVLIRLFQGSLPTSLGGMAASRRLDDGLQLIRPVVRLSDEQLQQYVASRGFSWNEDSTNGCDRYLRNAVRHRIVPAVRSVFPQAPAAVERLHRRMGDVSLLLDGIADRALAHVVEKDRELQLPVDAFCKIEPAVRDAVLYGMYDRLLGEGAPRLSARSVDRLRDALESSVPSWRIVAGETEARCSGGLFRWASRRVCPCYCRPLPPSVPLSIPLPDGFFFSVMPETASTDPLALRIAEGLLHDPIVRTPELADSIQLDGKMVLLSKLFSQWKIPPALRAGIPVLEDRNGIVAVFARHLGGRDRLCRRYKLPLAGTSSNIYSVSKRNK